MSEWKIVEGNWRWPYRVSDRGEVQKQLKSGGWRTLKPYPYSGQWRVQMWVDSVSWKRVQVSKLVADAFMGGTPPNMMRVHRNGMKHDNAVENIVFMSRAKAATQHRPGNSRPVAKLDENGEVVAIYSSTAEAARKSYISQPAVSRRCLGKVAHPFDWDGYNYVFADTLKC